MSFDFWPKAELSSLIRALLLLTPEQGRDTSFKAGWVTALLCVASALNVKLELPEKPWMVQRHLELMQLMEAKGEDERHL